MKTNINKNYRKISRDFKGRIELMNKIPRDVSIKLFFEMCDFFLNRYIEVEKERFPKKDVRNILIDMYKNHEKISGRKIKIWK